MDIMGSKTVTLDITSTTLRLLMVKGKKVVKWASAPVVPGLIDGGVIRDPEFLGYNVVSLMESSGIRSKKVTASVNGIYSIARMVILPVQNGFSREQMFQNVAEQALPLPPDEFYLSWKILSHNGKGNKALLVGMQPRIIDPEIQALKSVSIKPSIINLKGLALLKLIDTPNALMANIESDYVDIVLVSNGLPYVIRTVARNEDITLSDWAKDVTVLLEQTIMFCSTRYRTELNNSDTRCYLTGQLMDDQTVAGILRDSCRYPLGSITVPLDCPPNLPMNEYAVNLGLALKNTRIPQIVEQPVAVEVQDEDETLDE